MIGETESLLLLVGMDQRPKTGRGWKMERDRHNNKHRTGMVYGCCRGCGAVGWSLVARRASLERNGVGRMDNKLSDATK